MNLTYFWLNLYLFGNKCIKYKLSFFFRVFLMYYHTLTFWQFDSFCLPSHSLCSLGLRPVRDSFQMYLDVFRDPFESKIWSSCWVVANCQKVVPHFDTIFRRRLQWWWQISKIGLHSLVWGKMFVYLRPQDGPLTTVLYHCQKVVPCQKVGAW